MDYVPKSFIQAAVIVVLATLFWAGHRLIARLRKADPESWPAWLGLVPPPSMRLGSTLFAVFFGVGALLPLLLKASVPDFTAMMEASPQFAISRLPIASMVPAALAYAFVMTGFSEELLFRGVLAKRLLRWLGTRWGNLLQALVFALLHIVIIYAAVPDPGLGLLTFGAGFPGLMGWIAGWAMVRDGGSMFSPWLIHSGANLATVVTYFLLH